MRKTKLAIKLLVLLIFILTIPFSAAQAETALATELVVNGGGESSGITGWTDNTGMGRWSSMGTYSDWAPPAAGSNFFFFFFPTAGASPSDPARSGTMSQDIALSGTEGSGLFASISAGNIALHFTISMYQGISANNEAKAILEQFSAGGTLLETSEVVNTTSSGGTMGSYQINTQLNTATRKFRVTLSATDTYGGYAQFDQVSLKLADASTGSAPVFGSDFPISGTTDAGVAYSHGFTITDADAGQVNTLTFSASSTNINLVPAANVAVTGSGSSRTLTVTPGRQPVGRGGYHADGVRRHQKRRRNAPFGRFQSDYDEHQPCGEWERHKRVRKLAGKFREYHGDGIRLQHDFPGHRHVPEHRYLQVFYAD